MIVFGWSLASTIAAYAYDLAAERQRAMDWVHARRNGTNWVAVNESSNVGYTYDNALAIIAYTMAGDFGNARTLLNFLQSRQLPDGSWYDSMNQFTGVGVNTAHSSGNQAWALYAICFYTHHTRDRAYLQMAENVASWLILRQDLSDGGITGGISAGGTERAWTSTEHNLDAYFAFKLLYYLTNTPRYRDAQNRCKNWLLQVGWNSAGGRFNRGENDSYMALDTQTLGSLFLSDIKDYAKQDAVLAHIEATYYAVTIRQVGTHIATYTGFLDKIIDEEGTGRHWQEGTAQMAVACLRDGRSSIGLSYVEEVIESDDSSLKMGHPDEDNDGDGGKQYYLTGTLSTGLIETPSSGLWEIFAINDYLGDRQKIFFPLSPRKGGRGMQRTEL